MIYANLSNEEYHNHNSVSKTGLWTIQTKSPFHYKYGEYEETSAMRFGTAAHTAVLEPEKFEELFTRAAENRRGNNWKLLDETAKNNNMVALTFDEYDDALRVRDALHKDPLIRKITAGNIAREHSAFHDNGGVTVRCRPDLYNSDIKIMADLKTTQDARAYKFARSITDYGYHMQEAIYRDVWERAGGGNVDAFVFIAVEKTAPFAHVIYELDDESLKIGYDLYERSLDKYRECRDNNNWPSYYDNVRKISLSAWAKKLHEENGNE